MANKLTSIIPSGTNNYLTPGLSLNRLATDMLTPGVVGFNTPALGSVAPSTGSFAVNAQGSPNMTVAVSAGTAYVSATPSGGTAQTFAVTMDASENVTIASNSTGGTRYDFVYLVLDAAKLNNPAVTGLDVATLTTQRSTTQYVDSNGAPSNSLLLAEVTVSNGAVSIGNSNIADRRVSADFIDDGWINANETWAYASATTITVPTGATGKYSVGDKIRFLQSGSLKYFYIVGVATTTLTVTGGSDYTVANATISHPAYSHQTTPLGFPHWFNYTPTWTNVTIGNGTVVARFTMVGKKVSVYIKTTFGTTSSITGQILFSAPVSVSSNTTAMSYLGPCYMEDLATLAVGGVFGYGGTNSIGLYTQTANTTYVGHAATTGAAPFAWGNGDYFSGVFHYETA